MAAIGVCVPCPSAAQPHFQHLGVKLQHGTKFSSCPPGQAGSLCSASHPVGPRAEPALQCSMWAQPGVGMQPGSPTAVPHCTGPWHPPVAQCPCAESQPCTACLQVVCLWHAMSFLSSWFFLRESNVSQRMAAAFKAKMEPGNYLQKLLDGKDCLRCHNVSHRLGQHIGLHAPGEVRAMHLSCSRPNPAFGIGSWDSALY